MSYFYEDVLKNDFATFIGRTFATVDPGAQYLPNWHIQMIAEYLEAVRRGEIQRLIINMPPRSLKSVCVSVAWPAWLLGHDPKSKIVAASYAASLSTKHSMDCRQVMNSPWYRECFDVRLSKEQNEKRKFMTRARGYRMATSIGGSVMGEGGNFLIVDDPLNAMQAMNKIWRERVNNWFDHSFATRLDDKKKGAIVVVMQRLQQNDLSGYLLAKGGWEHLCLPAVAMKDQMYRRGRVWHMRGMGELLHPDREDVALVERARRELGSAAFAAQYQQAPVPEDGNLVKAWWFRRYGEAPKVEERRVQSWDTAIKSGDKHDASVCLTFGECEGVSYLLDAKVVRFEYPDLKRLMVKMAKDFLPQAILIEDRASGQQLLQDMKRETQLPVIGINPVGSKMTRFAAVSALIEAGRLSLPAEAPWLAQFEQEILAFPNVNHDDQVDALTQYLDWLRNSAWERLRVRQL